MLKGTTRQGIWHILPALSVPNKSLLPSQATMGQATETSSPASLGASCCGGQQEKCLGVPGLHCTGD